MVDAQSVVFCHAVVDKFKELLINSNGQIEVIYVYGGGANALKQWLYPQLIEALKDFSAQANFPILYLDSRYSRYLNRKGLFKVAENVAKM